MSIPSSILVQSRFSRNSTEDYFFDSHPSNSSSCLWYSSQPSINDCDDPPQFPGLFLSAHSYPA